MNNKLNFNQKGREKEKTKNRAMILITATRFYDA